MFRRFAPALAIASVFVGGTVVVMRSTQTQATLVADGALPVLARPYPIEQVVAHRGPNRSMAVLAKGDRVRVHGVGHEKDFAYYEVVLPDGRTGYVIHRDGALHVLRD
jgi:hypothetical protein